MKVAVLFDHFGPYHLARLRAVGPEAVGIEIHGSSKDYAWERADRAELAVQTLFPNPTLSPSAETFRETLCAALEQHRPDVVAIPGWSSRAALLSLQWCLVHQVPAILMSESSALDEQRSTWKEWVKRQIVNCCGAALVGGRRHLDYLVQLGMKEEQIFTGYDVVDNAWFAPTADREQKVTGTPHFLASARFIEKKNLARLLSAYHSYRNEAGTNAWNLKLVGDGPLRAELEQQIASAGLSGVVELPGFKQYAELPALYHGAAAFIHASTTEQWGLVVNEAAAAGLPLLVSERCGCVPELVQEGVNGFRFDPYQVESIKGTMLRLWKMSETERLAFGQQSEVIASHHDADQFGKGMQQAAEQAMKRPPAAGGTLAKMLISLLTKA